MIFHQVCLLLDEKRSNVSFVFLFAGSVFVSRIALGHSVYKMCRIFELEKSHEMMRKKQSLFVIFSESLAQLYLQNAV